MKHIWQPQRPGRMPRPTSREMFYYAIGSRSEGDCTLAAVSLQYKLLRWGSSARRAEVPALHAERWVAAHRFVHFQYNDGRVFGRLVDMLPAEVTRD